MRARNRRTEVADRRRPREFYPQGPVFMSEYEEDENDDWGDSGDDQPRQLGEKLPCSCCDCCPCLSTLTAGIALWAFYLAHLYFGVRSLANLWAHGTPTMMVAVLHVLFSHIYVRGIYSNTPPSVVFLPVSLGLILLRLWYYPL